jgi:dihydropteroate synthase
VSTSRHNPRLLRCDTPEELRAALTAVHADPDDLAAMLPQGRTVLLRLDGVSAPGARVLREHLRARGAAAALSAGADRGDEPVTGVLLIGSERALRGALEALRQEPLPELRALTREAETALDNALATERGAMRIGGRTFPWDERTYVMGIVNVTPDSFSGDGLLATKPSATGGQAVTDAAVRQALTFLAEGADILDVGGESTRPGGPPVDAETEAARVVPVIEALRRETDAPISVDTYKASVAQRALDAGADMVNDEWGTRMDPDMGPLVARGEIPVVLMHNRSRPRDATQEARLGGRYVGIRYADLVGDVLRELGALVEAAEAAGIARERIIIDPGIGFGKTVEQNLYLLNHLDALRVLGLPVLVGPSRKSFIGYTLDVPPEERMEGTAAAVALSVVRGADIVRVHDVRAMARVVRMVDAIMRAR